MFNNDSAASI